MIVDFDFWLRILQVFVLPVLIYFIRAIATIKDRTAANESRLTYIEQSIKATPDVKSFHDLAISIERLRGEVQTNNERLSGYGNAMSRLDRIVTRQENHLLNIKEK